MFPTFDRLLLLAVFMDMMVGYRRLQVRYERRADILLGFLYLACALICLKSLNRPKG